MGGGAYGKGASATLEGRGRRSLCPPADMRYMMRMLVRESLSEAGGHEAGTAPRGAGALGPERPWARDEARERARAGEPPQGPAARCVGVVFTKPSRLASRDQRAVSCVGPVVPRRRRARARSFS